MTSECDAGLLIGDPAFDADHASLGLTKVDLGEEWTAMTGLPFIYAAWTGRSGAVTAADVRALQDAQAEGVASRRRDCRGIRTWRRGGPPGPRCYLRDNVKYGLGADEAAGLQLFLDYAAELGLAPRGAGWNFSRRDVAFEADLLREACPTTTRRPGLAKQARWNEMIEQIAKKVRDGGRVDAGEALDTVSPGADASARLSSPTGSGPASIPSATSPTSSTAT